MNLETHEEPSVDPRVGERRRRRGGIATPVELDPRALERWENEGGRCACDALAARRA